MTDRNLARLGAASGALYAVLTTLGNGVIGSGGGAEQVPDLTSSRADVARWLTTLHEPGPLDWLGVLVEGAGLLCLLMFSAYLYSRLRAPENGRGWLAPAAFGGGLLAVSLKVGSLAPVLALYFRARAGFDPQLATALLDMNSFAFIQTWAALALMVGATAAAGIRYGALAPWLAWSGVAVAVLLLAAVPLAFGPAGTAMLVFLLWTIAASVTLTVRPDARPRGEAAAPRQYARNS